jgi:hypothetical protein
MNEFIRRVERASDIGTKVQELLQTLNSMEKGDPKRENFLEKLSDRMKTMDLTLATELIHGCILAAGKFGYGFFVSEGEAGDAIRMVIRVTERLQEVAQRVEFLSKCILDAADDTLAFRIQTVLSKSGQDFYLGVSFADLYPSFVERMMNRYGRNTDAYNMDLAYSDPAVFNLWGISGLSKEGMTLDDKTVADNRAAQRHFWLGYIGTSKKRLAEVFGIYFMPKGMYSGNSGPFIEQKIPIADLRNLSKTVTEDKPLNEANKLSLRILGRLLNGDFANGVAIDDWESGELG